MHAYELLSAWSSASTHIKKQWQCSCPIIAKLLFVFQALLIHDLPPLMGRGNPHWVGIYHFIEIPFEGIYVKS